MPIFRIAKLSRRLIMAMLLVTIPAMAAAILTLSHAASSYVQVDAGNDLGTRAELLAAKVNDWSEEATHDLLFIARHPDLTGMDSARHRALLLQALEHYPKFTYAHTIGLDGMNIARGDNLPLINFSDREYFKRIMAGAPIARETLLRSRSTGHPALNQVAPIVGPNGETLGVVVLGMDLQHIAQVLGTARYGKTGYSCLVDAEGHVLARVGLGDTALEDLSRLPPVAQAIQDHVRRYSRFRDARGVYWLAHAVPVANQWVVLSFQEEAEVLAEARHLSLQAAFLRARRQSR